MTIARRTNRLTAADLRRKKPDMYPDGGGLYLQVSIASDGVSINRSWIFRYAIGGRTHDMGLGSIHTINLVEARARARKCRQLLLDGINPLEQRSSERTAQALESAKAVSFEECAHRFINAHRDSWRNGKHALQWPRSLAMHIFPTLGKIPVGAIDTPLIVKALSKVWDTAPETASRIRGRIEAILDWATVAGLRQGDNPARWGGHLEHLLPAPRKRIKRHHAAMPYREVPSFMHKLRAVDSIGARALEFAVLTASRRGETLGATWDEVDFDAKTWAVPGTRMKNGETHDVPLSARCMEILTEMRAKASGDLIFPGREGQLAAATFERLLKTLGHDDITVHGFRSTFRDWAGEDTNFDRETIETALAHQVGSAVERAYRRARGLEKRRKLMEAWAQFCARPATTGATVTKLRRA